MCRPFDKKTYFLIMTGLLALASFNLFYRLGNFPIYSWDEARHGVSAFEMIKNHNYIVNTYRDKADYWNLKPPLSFWAIAAGYKLVGFNALGLRFCSAVFALITMIIVARFTYKKFGRAASVVALLVLITCSQYITNHSARTGDADSLFILLFTIAVLSLLQCSKNVKWLYLSGLAFAFAFLTKSWHAGNIAIIIALYLLVTGTFKQLTVKNWLLLIICMTFPILLWGVARYQYDGLTFFKEMVMYDLLHRSGSAIEGHVGGPSYYFLMISRFFHYWVAVIVLLGFVFLFKRKFSFRFLKNSDFIGMELWVLVPLLLFTIAKTKVRWYILPVYPPLAIIAGILAERLLQNAKWMMRTALVALILLVAIFYESHIVYYLNHPIADSKQSLIDMAAAKAQNDHLYIYHPSGASWSQSDTLSAELVADDQVQNGGLPAFLKTNHSLLLVPKKWYSQPMLAADHLKVLSSNQWGYVMEKIS